MGYMFSPFTEVKAKNKNLVNKNWNRLGDLSRNFVYYESLEDTHPDLFTSVLLKLITFQAEYSNPSYRTSRFVRNLANTERRKEEKALEYVFGDSLDIDPKTLSIKQITELFNFFLNTEPLYKRNLLLLQETEGQKSTMSFYDHYFTEAFKNFFKPENFPVKDFFDKVFDNEETMQVALSEIIENNLNEIIKEGLRLMATAGGENNIIKAQNEEILKAYEILTNNLNKLNHNPYIEQIKNIYGLQDLADRVSRSFKLKKNDTIDKRTGRIARESLVKGKRWSNSGNFVEVIQQMLINTISGTEIKTENFELEITSKLKALRVGNVGAADDVVAMIGIPEEEIEGIYGDIKDPSKIARLKKLGELSERLKKFKDSLLIHISAKNYFFNADFEKRGGYETTTMTPDSLSTALELAHINAPYLVSQIVNLCARACLDGLEKDVENQIAQYFAYIFFDDVQSIGEAMKDDSNDPISIHVLYLNGVDVPLSVFLEALADALESYNTESIVRVDIKAPLILYEDRPIDGWTQEHWDDQRNYAIAKTTIETHFLANIKDFFSQF